MITKHFTKASDEEIIQKVIQGDISSFELLIRRYNPALYKIGRAFRFRHEDVEDLMQETQVAAFVHLAKFSGLSSYKTWLLKIMINQCRQRLQKSSVKNEIQIDGLLQDNLESMPDNNLTRDTSRGVLNKELSRVLEEVISNLPADHSTIFTLRELNGLSVAETAETLEISETNVKVRLNRARKMLRKQLEKYYTPDDIFEFNLVYCDRIVEAVLQRIYTLQN